MNFLADESIEGPVVERLRADGHEVTYVAEMAPGIADDEILRIANERGAMLLTSDKDFGELVFRLKRVHHGVLLVRLAGLSNESKGVTVAKAVQEHGAQLLHMFSVISPGLLRIRGVID